MVFTSLADACVYVESELQCLICFDRDGGGEGSAATEEFTLRESNTVIAFRYFVFERPVRRELDIKRGINWFPAAERLELEGARRIWIGHGAGAWLDGAEWPDCDTAGDGPRCAKPFVVGICIVAPAIIWAGGKFAIGACTPDGGAVGAEFCFHGAGNETASVLPRFQEEYTSCESEENNYQNANGDFNHQSSTRDSIYFFS